MFELKKESLITESLWPNLKDDSDMDRIKKGDWNQNRIRIRIKLEFFVEN